MAPLPTEAAAPALAPLDTLDAYRHAAQTAWPQRDEPAALRTSLQAFEHAFALDPTDAATAVRLAHGYTLEASVFLRPARDHAGMQRNLARAVVVAQAALTLLAPAFAERLAAGDAFEDAVGVLPVAAVPGLAAYVEALGGYAAVRGATASLFYSERLRVCIERLLLLDEGYAMALPHRCMAIWYSRMPAFAGGSRKKAQLHFAKALALSADAPVNLVAYAHFADLGQSERQALGRALTTANARPNNAAASMGDDWLWGAAEARCAQREMERFLREPLLTPKPPKDR